MAKLRQVEVAASSTPKATNCRTHPTAVPHFQALIASGTAPAEIFLLAKRRSERRLLGRPAQPEQSLPRRDCCCSGGKPYI